MGTEMRLEEAGEKRVRIQDNPVSQTDESVVSSLETPSPSDEPETKLLTRRLLWKLDTRILPIFILLVLCSFLDRTNVGNAKVYNMDKELNLSPLQYQQGLAAFYPLYIAGEIPSNLVLKKITPRIWIAFMTFLWGLFCLCLGFVHNFDQFIALRALLGLAEGGLFPAMVLYLSTIYTRSELALRIGVLYTSTSLSSGFGGLLARAMGAIGDRGGLTAWRWIFVIEGLFTILCAVLTYFVLPNTLKTASFLSPKERQLAIVRQAGVSNNQETHEKFSWTEVRRAFAYPLTWLTASAYFGLLSAIYSIGLFLPTIILKLGPYTAHQAQLMTVPPYAVAAVMTLIVAFVSDRLRLRGIVMLFTVPVAIVGYAVIANISDAHPKVKYGMTIMMATGVYSSVPPNLAWLANNSAGHYKRATAAALQLAIANCGGILSVFLYPDADGPMFHRGHTIILGLLVAAWFLILANVLVCVKINKDKAHGKYDGFADCGDDRDPTFKLVL
ncbi:major facilitator superfamily domain-containing protein [Triangularia setosa]|uniref:Major facilitator superfamily domain-containing protein n=1 Tax=Triangularia setosa TaxID=2587417 RepID=A0AAN7A3R5_9PEZI|nr:major facilitator superfamily domain-containing protein [Podospora setosa]